MSVEAEKRIGRNANAGSAHTAANFSSKLLLPIPQSPRMANEAVLPVTKPCCKVWRKISISRLWPTNSSGLTRKLGSGSMWPLQNHESHNRQFTFVISVILWASPRAAGLPPLGTEVGRVGWFVLLLRVKV